MNKLEIFSVDEGENFKIKFTEEKETPFIKNRIVFGEMEDGKPIVLKISRFQNLVESEYYGLGLAYNLGLNVPKPIARIELSNDGLKGVLMERVHGKLLNEVGNEEAEFQAGLELSRFHEIRLPGFGASTNNVYPFDNPKDYIEFWTGKTMPYLENIPTANENLINLLEKAQPNIMHVEPRLLHKDVQDSNIIISDAKKANYIDFEWWQGGDPMDDLSTYLYHSIRTKKQKHLIRSFLLGYFKSNKISSTDRASLSFYTLLTSARVVSFCARNNPSMLYKAKIDLLSVIEEINR